MSSCKSVVEMRVDDNPLYREDGSSDCLVTDVYREAIVHGELGHISVPYRKPAQKAGAVAESARHDIDRRLSERRIRKFDLVHCSKLDSMGRDDSRHIAIEIAVSHRREVLAAFHASVSTRLHSDSPFRIDGLVRCGKYRICPQ